MRKLLQKPLFLLVWLVLALFLIGCGSFSTPTPLAISTAVAPPKKTLPVSNVPQEPATATPQNFGQTIGSAPTVAPTSTPTLPPTLSSQYEQAILGGVPVQIYVPGGIETTKRAQLLIILHGMGGTGEPMLKSLKEYADQNKWILLAPTFKYNTDWQNPQVIAEEEPRLTATLNRITEEASTFVGIPVKSQLLLYGFSRGAQLAHRYAIMYPEKTLAVAVISGGSYTLPFENTEQARFLGYLRPFEKEGTITFPFGVGDLSNYTGHNFNEAAFKRVNFWVQVGQSDNKNNEVPRQYDSYIGLNRLERATNFHNALKQLGVPATLTVFPNLAHSTSKEMESKACNYFKATLQKLQTVSQTNP
jgi:pimeloyl-ACP methyl ester carboxylesterase